MEYDFVNTLDHRQDGSYRWAQPAGRTDVIGMDTADMDFFCPPCVREATRRIWEENTFNYRAKPEGYGPALQWWYQTHYGLAVADSWLASAPGTIGAIRIALDLYARGGKVIMQSPYFTPIAHAIQGSGCPVVLNPMRVENGRYVLDFEDFERKVKAERPRVFMLVNPQNPTGRAFTKEELSHLVDICYENSVTILADEVHSFVTYEGHVHTPILAVSRKAQEISILVTSVSKGFNLMGLPHGIVLIPDAAKKAAWDEEIASYSFSYAYNAFSLAAVTSVLSPAGDDWLHAVTQHLSGNRRKILDFMRDGKLPLVPYAPDASYLMWIDCRKSGLDLEHIDKEFLDKAGIKLNNGIEHGQDGYGFVRMNYAVTEKVLQEALSRIQQMLA